jgi:hypothetical protein
MDEYWRRVVEGAWQRTKRPLGWSREKITGALVAVIAAFVGGGFGAVFNFVLASVGVVIGLAVVGLALFLWGIVETQADIYRSEGTERRRKIGTLEAAIERLTRPRPNYGKWRHVQKMDLKTAAFLWSGEQPGMKLIGQVRETYAMLQGAAQSGELELDIDASVDPRMQRTVQHMRQERANADTVVTREALKAFASRYDYNPEFLRD